MTFDLEKARDVCAGMERFRGQTIQCTHIGAHLAAAMLPEALAEIERLRAIIDKPLEERIWIMDRDILSASSDDAEVYLARRWHAAYRKAQNSNLIRAQEIERQAARIQELEDALAEERAKQFDVDEPCPARTHHEYCDILKGLCDGFPHTWEKCPRKQKKLDAARQQLRAEGKIGSGDHIVEPNQKVWQITDERKAAFVWILRRLEYDQSLPGHTYYKIQQAMELLRAMLEEAGQ